MPWTNYVDSVGGGKYAFRVYLTEGTGSVLGANFMNGYNVIFDAENNRVGFSQVRARVYEYMHECSACAYIHAYMHTWTHTYVMHM
jgi:hypothetical protein